jgi:hypothetical protein
MFMPSFLARSVALLLALPSLASGAEPLADAVRQAVAGGKVRETDIHGAATAPSPYRDTATDGAVLAGFEVGLGGPPAGERVVAVRPVYRLDGRDRPGAPAGHFLADEVTRTVRVIARPGYAVAGLSVSAGRRLEGLSIRFARIDQAALDPKDAYESPWVGSADASRRAELAGDAQPVVGVFGRIEGDAVVAIGLMIADVPRAAAPSPAPAPLAGSARRSALWTVSPQQPDQESSGIWPWVLVVLGLGAVVVGGVWMLARRRKRPGIRQLPRVRTTERGSFLRERPRSIPEGVFSSPLPVRTPPPANDPTRLDSDYVWR